MRSICYFLIGTLLTFQLKASEFDEHPKQLSETEINNIVAFAKLYGYVRFFHPSNEALATDWDRFAVNGIQEVEAAKDSTELLATLQKLFAPVAPTMKIGWIKKKPSFFQDFNTAITNSQTGKIRYWHYKGYAGEGTRWIYRLLSMYRSGTKTVKVKDLEKQKIIINDPVHPFTAHVTNEIGILMPSSVYIKGGRSLPHTNFKKKKEKEVYSLNNRSARMAIVIASWNMYRFFYPYWDVVGTDWNQSLANALQKCAADTSDRDFKETMERMIASSNDGHGFCGMVHRGENPVATGELPLSVGWIENEVVITNCTNCDSLGIKPGDIVQSINGKHMWEYIRDKEPRTSGASDAVRKRIMMLYLFYGPLDSTVTLKLKDASGKIYEKKLLREKQVDLPLIAHDKIEELEGGIYYLNFDKLKNKDFKKALPKLQTAKGIIFDMRTYPSIGEGFLNHLSQTNMKSARWMAPILTSPEAVPTQFDTSGRWNLKPKKPFLSCPKVFIASEVDVSYAESLMGIIEAYKMGEIVGTPTAGTNGNINYVEFLNLFGIVFTGLKVLKNDGSQHHGIGILPTVYCPQTIQAIRDGKDAQLEKAIEVLKGKINQ